MKFEKGNKIAKGGKRKNAGRTPEVFREWCRKMATSKSARKLLSDVIDGKPIEEKKVFISKEFPEVTTLVTPNIETRRKVVEMFLDRGFGKPVQQIETKEETKIDPQQFAEMKRDVAEFLKEKGGF